MFITLIVLSLAAAKAETPATPGGKLKCLNPVRVNPKLESTVNPGTEKCLAIPAPSEKPSRVRK